MGRFRGSSTTSNIATLAVSHFPPDIRLSIHRAHPSLSGSHRRPGERLRNIGFREADLLIEFLEFGVDERDRSYHGIEFMSVGYLDGVHKSDDRRRSGDLGRQLAFVNLIVRPLPIE